MTEDCSCFVLPEWFYVKYEPDYFIARVNGTPVLNIASKHETKGHHHDIIKDISKLLQQANYRAGSGIIMTGGERRAFEVDLFTGEQKLIYTDPEL